jgi:hypothetical protein
MPQEVGSGQIHAVLRGLRRYRVGFNASDLPENGIYFFYEEGETFEGAERIVRVGTHVGEGRLSKRLKLHYSGTARRSVFRRNVGNAILRAGLVGGIPSDATHLGSGPFSAELEDAISTRFYETFSFRVVRVDDRDDRLRLEAGSIALLAAEPMAVPSANWLGRSSPVDAIQTFGLWNRNHVAGAPLSVADFDLLCQTL